MASVAIYRFKYFKVLVFSFISDTLEKWFITPLVLILWKWVLKTLLYPKHCIQYYIYHIAIMLILHNACTACYINLNSTVFQEPCVTSTSTSAPSTRVTMGVHVLMASTASPACVQRATMMLPVCHKWMSVAATRASMAVARILSMGECRFRF